MSAEYQWLKDIRAGGAVKRSHTVRTIRIQTNADHSWGVCMALLAAGLASPTATAGALLHDVPEVATGDVPANAKWANPALAAALEEEEKKFERQYDIHIEMSGADAAALSWADTYDLGVWCLEERKMGNTYVDEMFWRVSQALEKKVKKLDEVIGPAATDKARGMTTDLRKEYSLVCK